MNYPTRLSKFLLVASILAGATLAFHPQLSPNASHQASSPASSVIAKASTAAVALLDASIGTAHADTKPAAKSNESATPTSETANSSANTSGENAGLTATEIANKANIQAIQANINKWQEEIAQIKAGSNTLTPDANKIIERYQSAIKYAEQTLKLYQVIEAQTKAQEDIVAKSKTIDADLTSAKKALADFNPSSFAQGSNTTQLEQRISALNNQINNNNNRLAGIPEDATTISAEQQQNREKINSISTQLNTDSLTDAENADLSSQLAYFNLNDKYLDIKITNRLNNQTYYDKLKELYTVQTNLLKAQLKALQDAYTAELARQNEKLQLNNPLLREEIQQNIELTQSLNENNQLALDLDKKLSVRKEQLAAALTVSTTIDSQIQLLQGTLELNRLINEQKNLLPNINNLTDYSKSIINWRVASFQMLADQQKLRKIDDYVAALETNSGVKLSESEVTNLTNVLNQRSKLITDNLNALNNLISLATDINLTNSQLTQTVNNINNKLNQQDFFVRSTPSINLNYFNDLSYSVKNQIKGILSKLTFHFGDLKYYVLAVFLIILAEVIRYQKLYLLSLLIKLKSRVNNRDLDSIVVTPMAVIISFIINVAKPLRWAGITLIIINTVILDKTYITDYFNICLIFLMFTDFAINLLRPNGIMNSHYSPAGSFFAKLDNKDEDILSDDIRIAQPKVPAQPTKIFVSSRYANFLDRPFFKERKDYLTRVQANDGLEPWDEVHDLYIPAIFQRRKTKNTTPTQVRGLTPGKIPAQPAQKSDLKRQVAASNGEIAKQVARSKQPGVPGKFGHATHEEADLAALSQYKNQDDLKKVRKLGKRIWSSTAKELVKINYDHSEEPQKALPEADYINLPNANVRDEFAQNARINQSIRSVLMRVKWFMFALVNVLFFNVHPAVTPSENIIGQLLYILTFALLYIIILKNSRKEFNNIKKDYGVVNWKYRLLMLAIYVVPLLLIVLTVNGYVNTTTIIIDHSFTTYYVAVVLFVVHRSIKRLFAVLSLSTAKTAGKQPVSNQNYTAGFSTVAKVEDDKKESIYQKIQHERQEEFTRIRTKYFQEFPGFSQLATVISAIISVFCIYYVWSDLMSIVNYLNNVTIWQVEGAVAGTMDNISLLNLLKSVLYLVITMLIYRNLKPLLDILLFSRINLSAGLPFAVQTVLGYLILAFGFGGAFSALGLSWSKLQWLFSALLIGIGFGLQEIFANFVSGIIILFERPIRINDYVTINSITGRVSNIRIRATTIVDPDNKEVIIPNKTFVTGQFTNWSLTDTQTRLVYNIGVAYGSDVDLVTATLLEAANMSPAVMQETSPPSCFFMEFGASSLNFVLRVHVPALSDRMITIHDINRNINNLCNARNINIAFNQLDVYVKDGSGLNVKIDSQVNKANTASPAAGASSTQTTKPEAKITDQLAVDGRSETSDRALTGLDTINVVQ